MPGMPGGKGHKGDRGLPGIHRILLLFNIDVKFLTKKGKQLGTKIAFYACSIS